MDFFFIAVAADPALPLTGALLRQARDCLGETSGPDRWLAHGKAAEFSFTGEQPGPAVRSALEMLFAPGRVDFFLLPAAAPRRKRLLVADMDNTMIVGETLDELAEQCGLKERVAAITERAMQGELDFSEALRRRVAMLAGLPEAALARTLAGIRLMPGAETLVRTMRSHGARCVLVSGGFSCFTAPIARRLGFHSQHGNQLEIRDGALSGRVAEPIIDSARKLYLLGQHLAANALAAEDCLAIGDGANDFAMLAAAGFGVGYHPKPFLKARVSNSILHGDLTALLYSQGYTGF
jgi:phosphoserine phosphatase